MTDAREQVENGHIDLKKLNKKQLKKRRENLSEAIDENIKIVDAYIKELQEQRREKEVSRAKGAKKKKNVPVSPPSKRLKVENVYTDSDSDTDTDTDISVV